MERRNVQPRWREPRRKPLGNPRRIPGPGADGKITYWEVFSDTSIVFDIIKAKQAEVER